MIPRRGQGEFHGGIKVFRGEEENSKLKRIVADLSLDKTMLQDVLSKTL